MSRRVLLVSMPFGPMTRPAIGISLLKAELARQRLACDLRYFNLFFARLVGADTYRELSEDIPTASLLGDWLFREELFDSDPERDREYLEEYLPRHYRGAIHPDQLDLYVSCRALAGPFLDACLDQVDWSEVALLGLTTTFQQTVPSLALARRVRERFPQVRIALGGANCEGEMGRELHRKFPFLDFVFSGESDATFPRLARAVLESPGGPIPALPGLTHRGGAEGAAVSHEPHFIRDLDALPFPDYSDFTAALEREGLADTFNIQFLIETSRGCWWGQKQHCTFCGLNGLSMTYRSKSPERVIEELRHLVDRYGAKVVWGTDNILDVRYFKTVLPVLEELGLELSLFFETKANLRKEQLRLMRDVGMSWFQPGIESLNTHQLQLMRKGTTALQNIQLLKWVRQYRMLVTWNMLMGFPGETEEDYHRLAGYCDALVHLQPPSGAHPIRLDRFSPYFATPEAYGITDLEPYASYRYVYPFDDDSLGRLAYFFLFRYTDGYDPVEAGRPMLEAVQRWLHPETFSVLYAIPGERLLLILDTRPGAPEARRVLAGVQADLYVYCDAIRSRASILDRAHRLWPEVPETEVRTFLDQMLEDRLMLEEDGRYLSLAVLLEEGADLGAIPDPRQLAAATPPTPPAPAGSLEVAAS